MLASNFAEIHSHCKTWYTPTISSFVSILHSIVIPVWNFQIGARNIFAPCNLVLTFSIHECCELVVVEFGFGCHRFLILMNYPCGCTVHLHAMFACLSKVELLSILCDIDHSVKTSHHPSVSTFIFIQSVIKQILFLSSNTAWIHWVVSKKKLNCIKVGNGIVI